ncbi:MAG: hypothetical protein [Sanya fiers-like virus 41]|nr:MAG: hypothetical protein [Sanya fiers-like virus 41]
MPQQANIVINDGAGTPVAHTYVPKGSRVVDNRQISAWRDQSQANYEAQWSITESLTPFNSNGMAKLTYTIDVPTMETPGGTGPFVPPPTRAFGTIAKCEFWIHKRSVVLDRNHALQLMKNLLANANVTTAVTTLESHW